MFDKITLHINMVSPVIAAQPKTPHLSVATNDTKNPENAPIIKIIDLIFSLFCACNTKTPILEITSKKKGTISSRLT